MRKTAIVCAILAASMLTGPLAFAQGDSRFGDRGRNDQGQRSDERDRRGNEARPSHNKGNNGRGNAYGNNKRYERYERTDRRERGVGPDQGYYRGDRMPLQYRSRQYVIEDWRGHQLSAPPRGYHWVQSGGDYVLVAIATGIILQLLLSN